MSKSSKEDEIIDDLCVRREEIEKLFHPKPARTTFHDWVNKGLIVMARGLRGYYLLNKTRVRLGMNPVDLKRYRKEMAIPQVDSEQVKENFEKEEPKADLGSNPPAYMSVKEAATYLTVSPATMHREIQARRVKVVRIGRRVLLRKVDLDRYIETNANWLNE